MKLIFSLLLSIGAASSAQASGCGFYEFIRQVHETDGTHYVDPAKYEVLIKESSFIRIRLKDRNKTEITMPMVSSQLVAHGSTVDERLEAEDVYFEEGPGCGPIYECVTGRYRIKMYHHTDRTVRDYAWPVITEVFDYNYDYGYMSDSLLPVFGEKLWNQLNAHNDWVADRNQCAYGSW